MSLLGVARCHAAQAPVERRRGGRGVLLPWWEISLEHCVEYLLRFVETFKADRSRRPDLHAASFTKGRKLPALRC